MPEQQYCLGKLPARPNSTKLKFSTYVDVGAVLPKIPKDFGHEESFGDGTGFGMLGNAQYGDCVLAGGAHEHMLWARMGGKNLTFNTADVLRDFTGVTGLPPGPEVGADMQQAAAYRLKTGLLGADKQRHKISAYLALRKGDLKELYAAMYLFGCVGIGVAISTAQMKQFQNHQAWAITLGFPLGLHYVPCVALRGNIVVVTWGRFQAMRPSFYVSESDEAIVYLSDEALTGGKSLEGFDRTALLTDMRLISQGATA